MERNTKDHVTCCFTESARRSASMLSIRDFQGRRLAGIEGGIRSKRSIQLHVVVCQTAPFEWLRPCVRSFRRFLFASSVQFPVRSELKRGIVPSAGSVKSQMADRPRNFPPPHTRPSEFTPSRRERPRVMSPWARGKSGAILTCGAMEEMVEIQETEQNGGQQGAAAGHGTAG